jgi:hypothetical protein
MSIFHHHAMATGASCLASACSSAGTLISNPFFYESGRGAPVYGLAEAVGVAATPVAEDEEVLVLVETGAATTTVAALATARMVELRILIDVWFLVDFCCKCRLVSFEVLS